MQTKSLLKKYKFDSDQISFRELEIILTELESQITRYRHISVVEFGCYAGNTSMFIQRLLESYNHAGAFHVYDSFVGLPDKKPQDDSPAGTHFKAGELAVSKQTFIMNFKKAGLRIPHVHKGWFSELADDQVPDLIGFAYLDGDYYESIQDSFRLIERKLRPDATIIVDDYANEALPGASLAVNEWLQGKQYKLQITTRLAIIHLQS